MSNEIRFVAGMHVSKGGFATPFTDSDSYYDTLVGDKVSQGVMGVGTGYQAIPKGSLTNVGWLILKNLGDEETIEIGTGAGLALIEIPPGKAVLFRAGAGLQAPAAKVAANTSVLQFMLLEP